MRTASLAAVAVLVGCAIPAAAKEVPYYRMDSLAYLATDIILCDELAETEGKYGEGKIEFPTVTVSVVRVLKGNFTPGERLTFEVAGYDRVFLETAPAPRPRMPLGRAVYFLEHFDGAWKPVSGGVKPIYNGEAYCYGQFYSNPGGRWLARMAPENFAVPDTEPYGEQELLADLEIAMEKAKRLTKPAEMSAGSGGIIRSDYRLKKMMADLLWPVVGVAIGALVAVALWWQLGRKPSPQRYE